MSQVNSHRRHIIHLEEHEITFVHDMLAEAERRAGVDNRYDEQNKLTRIRQYFAAKLTMIERGE